MKKSLMFLLVALSFSMVAIANAQQLSILDFCYFCTDEYGDTTLETYSANDCLGNLIDKGFSVVSSKRSSYIGPNDSVVYCYDRVLRKSSANGKYTTVYLSDADYNIKFASKDQMYDFVDTAVSCGAFVWESECVYRCRSGLYPLMCGIFGFEVNYSTYELDFYMDTL